MFVYALTAAMNRLLWFVTVLKVSRHLFFSWNSVASIWCFGCLRCLCWLGILHMNIWSFLILFYSHVVLFALLMFWFLPCLIIMTMSGSLSFSISLEVIGIMTLLQEEMWRMTSGKVGTKRDEKKRSETITWFEPSNEDCLLAYIYIECSDVVLHISRHAKSTTVTTSLRPKKPDVVQFESRRQSQETVKSRQLLTWSDAVALMADSEPWHRKTLR